MNWVKKKLRKWLGIETIPWRGVLFKFDGSIEIFTIVLSMDGLPPDYLYIPKTEPGYVDSVSIPIAVESFLKHPRQRFSFDYRIAVYREFRKKEETK